MGRPSRPASAAFENVATTNGSTAAQAGCLVRQPAPSEDFSSPMTSSREESKEEEESKSAKSEEMHESRS